MFFSASPTGAVVRFEGGPLDGLKLRVLQREAVSPSLGFCTVTDAGPVQCVYADGGGGLRVFGSMARVPRDLPQAPFRW